mmetsp:Transcript_36870/g.86138  ORF Transcript_36870/g.86138 Transcript_36870/m.86138 type:complete len:296 (-) Transcript_36870:195-1082(-)
MAACWSRDTLSAVALVAHAPPLKAHLLESVVSEGYLVIVVVIVVGESVLGAQEGEGGRHRRVLVLERELARVGVRLHHRLHHLAAHRRVGVCRLLGHLAVDGGDDSGGPLHDVHLLQLVRRHVRNDAELLHARREDHLAHVPRAALPILRALLWLRVHRGHGDLQQAEVAVGRLDGGAEELEAAHVRRALDLDALLAALLDHLLEELLLLLGGVLGGLLRLLGGLLRGVLLLLLLLGLLRLLFLFLLLLGLRRWRRRRSRRRCWLRSRRRRRSGRDRLGRARQRCELGGGEGANM